MGMGYVGRPGMGKLITRIGFDGEESRRVFRDEDFFGTGSSVNRHMTNFWLVNFSLQTPSMVQVCIPYGWRGDGITRFRNNEQRSHLPSCLKNKYSK